MSLNGITSRLEEEAAAAPTLVHAMRPMTRVAQDMGFYGACFLVAAPSGRDRIVTIAADPALPDISYISQLLSESGKWMIGPIHRQSFRSALPLAWAFDFERKRIVGLDHSLSANEFTIMRKARRRVKVGSGLTTPIYGETGFEGCLTMLSFEGGPASIDLHKEKADDLIAIAYRFHDAIKPKINRPSADKYSLTPREVDCLRRAARGDTINEIAKALGISYRTVRHHLENSDEKLGTNARLHTVAKASYLGLLGPIH